MLANATRSRTELYLIGSSVSELRGSKLPSLRMVLGFFLHLHLELNETIRHSSAAALEQVFEEWRLLKKNKARKSSTQQAREAAFVSRLEDLFDIAHADALNTMSIQEEKDFLLAQREKGRRGSMVGVDETLACKEKRVSEREQQTLKRRQQTENIQQIEATTAELTTSGSEISAAEDVDSEGAVGGSRTQKRKRGRKAVVTPELAAALDRTKVSDRKAVFVIAETAKSLGMTIDQLALNRDSVRRLRAKHRIHSSASIRAKFQSDVPLVVHWDGKLIPDLIGKEKVDRLPVLVSGKEVLQLLTVAKLPSGTGEAQASAVFGAIEDWGIPGNIRAMCFDTRSSNTGRISGACVLLEQQLGKELLSLACRHHIMELVIGAAFRVCYSCERIRVYLKAWISAPLASGAPYSDLLLLKSLLEYLSIHLAISKATSNKFSGNLWYLSPELVGLTFFDSHVSSSTKRLMVSAMQSEDDQEQEHTKRITIDLDSAKNKNLEHFVTAKSAKLFQMMDLSDGFLTVDPDLWEDRHDYGLASETVRSLKVVNDHAERGVALIQEYSGFITQDESQLQFLLQVVNEHRRVYPDSRKQTLSGQP
ncbi:hypothetical protein QYM36_019238 [Artemia franciscana]|uniref:Uncharacterized protein n=1 Tax=Artemia franciscana TaxID=6661 RepID=A0AA88H5H8_ARTSF|nr:hypothetical protein QYM36_019238 [Artemia franciscana]